MDDELEALRKKRMAELQQQNAMSQDEMVSEEQKRQEEFEAQKKAILRQILTNEARERLARVRMARPKVAENLEAQLVMLVQSGRIRDKITDEQLRELLSRIIPEKRDITIERRGI